MYTITAPDWSRIAVKLVYWSYVENNNLAIELVVDKDYEDKEIFKWESRCYLTVNIKPLPSDMIALDINNFPDALKFVEENDIAHKVDEAQSWFVTYPIVKFNNDFFRKNSTHILAQC